MISQQYRAWSDCTDVQANLALYWWQRLISFGVGRIRVKTYPISNFFYIHHNFSFDNIFTKYVFEL